MIPFKATQATVECTIARLLAAAAVGMIAYLVAPRVGAHFDYALGETLQYGIGLTTAVLTWFASRSLFDFTADCMDVPNVSPAFSKPSKPATGTPVFGLAPKPAAAASTSSGAAKLETFPQDDGTLKVSITFTGLTKREFNALRGRLGTIRGVTWLNPRNLGNGQRLLEGSIPAGPSRPEALKKLEELTGQRF